MLPSSALFTADTLPLWMYVFAKDTLWILSLFQKKYNYRTLERKVLEIKIWVGITQNFLPTPNAHYNVTICQNTRVMVTFNVCLKLLRWPYQIFYCTFLQMILCEYLLSFRRNDIIEQKKKLSLDHKQGWYWQKYPNNRV